MRSLIITIVFLSFSFDAIAQDVDPLRLEELKTREQAEKIRVENLQSKKREILKDIQSLSRDVKKISSDLSKIEIEYEKIRSNLKSIEGDKAEVESKIVERKRSISEMLAALQRIESNPPPALATHPSDAAKASRAGLLLASLTEQISDRVSDLNIDLQNYDRLQAQATAEREILNQTKSNMLNRRKKLEDRVQAKHVLERSVIADYEASRTRHLALAQQAQDLQDLIDSLERKSKDIVPRIKPDPNSADAETETETSRPPRTSEQITFLAGDLRFSSSKGKLYPVTQGRLSKRYSSSHPGLSILTVDGGQVFAPASGRVEFAGPFKNYDQVVILNVGDGFYILLTGLNRLLVQDNSKVSAGDPVGLMPVNSPNDEKLYIELRKNGSTIDPVPWFGTTFAKPRSG